jgi:hypothetical protein
VRWTLGGKNSTFVEGLGALTAFQHDARPVGPDLYTVFDNGASPPIHPQSRGVVLDVDPGTDSVSVRSQFLFPGHRLLADSQGDMQALPNGDWFVGWGAQPDFSEFSAKGRLLFDASLPSGYESYRSLRFSWNATPATRPALAVSATPGGRGVAYASWNGATGVVKWELLEGSSRSRMVRVEVVRRTDFETTFALGPRRTGRFVKVRALGASDAVLASSATVALAGSGG